MTCFLSWQEIWCIIHTCFDTWGITLVEELDDAGAEAVMNITQQRIIKWHWHHHFGRRVFIPDKKCHLIVSITTFQFLLVNSNTIRMHFRSQKINYWHSDSTFVLSKELKRLIVYTNDLDVMGLVLSVLLFTWTPLPEPTKAKEHGDCALQLLLWVLVK